MIHPPSQCFISQCTPFQEKKCYQLPALESTQLSPICASLVQADVSAWCKLGDVYCNGNTFLPCLFLEHIATPCHRGLKESNSTASHTGLHIIKDGRCDANIAVLILRGWECWRIMFFSLQKLAVRDFPGYPSYIIHSLSRS